MDTVQIYTNMVKTFSDRMSHGLRTFEAARDSESEVIAAYKNGNRELLSRAALAIVRSSKAKDKGKIMKIIHAVAKGMDANAEAINGVLATFASAISTERFTWTSKVQHALVAKVDMGDRTKLSEEYGLDTEYKGFDGTPLVHYLLSFSKEDWARKAVASIYRELCDTLRPILEQDGTLEQHACGFTSRQLTASWSGSLDWKIVWTSLARVSFRSSAYEKYVVEDEALYEGSEPPKVTAKLNRLKLRHTKVDDDGAVIGDHYNIERFEDILAERRKIDLWAVCHELWPTFKPLVDEYNEVAAWGGLSSTMPTGDIAEYEQSVAKATIEKLQDNSVDEQILAFMATLNANQAEQEKAVANLV